MAIIFQSPTRRIAANERSVEMPISDAIQGAILITLTRENWPLTNADPVVRFKIDIITDQGTIPNFIGAVFHGGDFITENGLLTACHVGSTHPLPNVPNRRFVLDYTVFAPFRSAVTVETV